MSLVNHRSPRMHEPARNTTTYVGQGRQQALVVAAAQAEEPAAVEEAAPQIGRVEIAGAEEHGSQGLARRGCWVRVRGWVLVRQAHKHPPAMRAAAQGVHNPKPSHPR